MSENVTKGELVGCITESTCGQPLFFCFTIESQPTKRREKGSVHCFRLMFFNASAISVHKVRLNLLEIRYHISWYCP